MTPKLAARRLMKYARHAERRAMVKPKLYNGNRIRTEALARAAAYRVAASLVARIQA